MKTIHPELNQWYHENKTRLSPTRGVFRGRVTIHGRTKERSIIKTHKIKKPKQITTMIDENGRECTKCNEYKTRSEYAKYYKGIYGHTSDCKECRNKAKKIYREKTGYEKDREYRQKSRKLNIGDKVKLKALTKYKDTYIMPVWEVVDYKFKKGYTIFSSEYGVYRQLDTNDNKVNRTNSVGFYKV